MGSGLRILVSWILDSGFWWIVTIFSQKGIFLVLSSGVGLSLYIYVRSAVVWCQRTDSIVASMLALYMHLQRMKPRFGSIRQYVKAAGLV